MRLQRGVTMFVALLSMFLVSTVKAEEKPVVATSPRVVTLSYVPGAASNTIRVAEFNGQKYVLSTVLGSTCLLQTAKSATGDWNWYFDVADGAWNKRVGDGVLIVDFVASTVHSLNWFAYDTAFHRYNRLDQPPFAALIHRDVGLGITTVRQESHGNNRFSATWLLRKVFFGNRCGGAFDFVLNPYPAQSIGITRITLQLLPVSRPPRASSVDAGRLIQAIYRRWFGRLPKPAEQRMILESFGRGDLSFPSLLRRLMQTREFRQRNFRPFVRKELLERLFRLVLWRNPTNSDMDFLFEDFDSDSNDGGIIRLTEKYYPLIVEKFIAELESPDRCR